MFRCVRVTNPQVKFHSTHGVDAVASDIQQAHPAPVADGLEIVRAGGAGVHGHQVTIAGKQDSAAGVWRALGHEGWRQTARKNAAIPHVDQGAAHRYRWGMVVDPDQQVHRASGVDLGEPAQSEICGEDGGSGGGGRVVSCGQATEVWDSMNRGVSGADAGHGQHRKTPPETKQETQTRSRNQMNAAPKLR